MLVSVCIPVHNTEMTLERALQSVASQVFESDFSSSFKNTTDNITQVDNNTQINQINQNITAQTDISNIVEIVLVNDGSSGKDSKGRTCKKIVKQFRKEFNIPLQYIENPTNLGLIETRRVLAEVATGSYITMLDSDDELLPHALETMLSVATKTNADIVQAKTEVFYSFSEEYNLAHNLVDGAFNFEKYALAKSESVNKSVLGTLNGSAILDSYVIKNEQNAYLWAKLIKREIYQKAFEKIPFTRCNMGEDFLIYSFCALFAQKYVGIENIVHRYSLDTGMSSCANINTLSRWEQICSAASVFAVFFEVIAQECNLFSSEQVVSINTLCRSYLKNNILQLRKAVVKELQEDAFALLCEYWGEDFVKKMESEIKNI